MWSTGINRNIVECKVIEKKINPNNDPVLIETLWNVKCIGKIAMRLGLIRINRNIVECKER